jgi:hypothetical protein
MTKKICFVLILAIAGMASVNAQMRIGGSEAPNQSAVLDLNPDNNMSSGNATMGLALPRVNLRNCGDAFPLLSHVKGMAVYNMATAGDVTSGVYVNNGAKWLRQLDSNTPVLTSERDSIVGNEVVDATLGGGLIRDGGGTEISPYTLGIAEGGVTTDKIANQSVTYEKLSEDASAELREEFSFVFDYYNPTFTERVINLVHENERDGVIGNEVTDATIGGGLVRSGGGTEVSPYTLGISEGGVTTGKIANKSVTYEKLSESTLAELREEFSFVFDYYNPTFTERVINLIHENEKDGVIGNEVVGATDGSLQRSGAGTQVSPYTLAVSENGIETRHLRNDAVTVDKIANDAVSTRHIQNYSVTMDKLSNDVLWKLHEPVKPENLASSNPHSILVSDAHGQWKPQKVTGDEIICNYSWNSGHPAGWVDLGYSGQTIPVGLYAAQIHINYANSTKPVEYIVLDAGPQSIYTLARKSTEARNSTRSVESCVIYVEQNSRIRLFVHATNTSYSGLAAIILQPIIQLQY